MPNCIHSAVWRRGKNITNQPSATGSMKDFTLLKYLLPGSVCSEANIRRKMGCVAYRCCPGSILLIVARALVREAPFEALQGDDDVNVSEVV